MSKVTASLDDLFQLFEDNISLSDIISSKYLGKISAAIVQKRLELNMNQKQFADFLNVSQGMISKWEGGDYNFTVKSLAQIAEKLDMHLYISLKPANAEMSYSQTSNFSYINSSPKKFITSNKIIDMQSRKHKIDSYHGLKEM